MLESIPALLSEIQSARDAFNLDSSNFLAERLVQIDPSEPHLNILAESYLQSRQFSQARQLLQNCQGKRSRYLLALACFKLDKLKEAEQVLTSSKKFGVEDFLSQGKDPKEMGKSFGKMGKDYFGGISVGVASGLISQKPMANYSDNFQLQRAEQESESGNPFFVSHKKGGNSQYLLNWTKKGLNTFTDFFGKKPKKKQEENTPKPQETPKMGKPDAVETEGTRGKSDKICLVQSFKSGSGTSVSNRPRGRWSWLILLVEPRGCICWARFITGSCSWGG